MSKQENKALFRRHVQIWATGDLSTIEQLIDPDYVGHVSTGDRNLSGLVSRIEAFRVLYPDIVFTIEDQIADGDLVATRLTAHGIHKPTGKAVTLIGMNISRIDKGRIVEEWATWEALADS